MVCVICLRGLFKSEWFFREAESIDSPSNAKNLWEDWTMPDEIIEGLWQIKDEIDRE